MERTSFIIPETAEGYDQQKEDFLFNVFDGFEYLEVTAVNDFIDHYLILLCAVLNNPSTP